jgi:hypothetical protein
MLSLNVEFLATGIAFHDYPFPPASIYPSSLLGYDTIREVLPDMAPPEVRTHRGEVLFISAVQKEQLRAAAEQHGLPIVTRVDIWDFILEPFLDTEYSEEDQARTLQILQENGIDSQRCEALRSRVGAAMYRYNFATMLWEWVHLGLYDLLLAIQDDLNWTLSGGIEAFYWEAMSIAEQGALSTLNTLGQ